MDVWKRITSAIIEPVIMLIIIIAAQLSTLYACRILEALRIDVAVIILLIGIILLILGNVALRQQYAKLITTGVYKYTRNPSYLGGLSASVGIALYAWNILAVVLSVIFYYSLDKYYIPLEEEMLQQLYGDQYKEYTEAVKRWI